MNTQNPANNYSCDALLGGRVLLWQPRKGYRVAIDPVLLAAGIEAKAGEAVCELGLGTGAASLCLLARCPDLQVFGIERDPEFATLAARSAADNKRTLAIIEADIEHLLNALPANMPEGLADKKFKHVFANPPYYDSAQHSPSPHHSTNIAHASTTAAHIWAALAAKLLADNGVFTLILPASAQTEWQATLTEAGFGGLQLLPLLPKAGQAPKRILLRGFLGQTAPLQLCAPLILHEGAGYSTEAEAVLRHAAPLLWKMPVIEQ